MSHENTHKYKNEILRRNHGTAAAGKATRIQYEVDTALAGKFASIGQPVVKAKARDMEKQFAKSLQVRFDSKAVT